MELRRFQGVVEGARVVPRSRLVEEVEGVGHQNRALVVGEAGRHRRTALVGVEAEDHLLMGVVA